MMREDVPCQKGSHRNPFLHNFSINYTLVLLVFVKSTPAQVIHFFYPSTFNFNFSSGVKSSTFGRRHAIPTYSCERKFFVGMGYIRGFLFQNHPT